MRGKVCFQLLTAFLLIVRASVSEASTPPSSSCSKLSSLVQRFGSAQEYLKRREVIDRDLGELNTMLFGPKIETFINRLSSGAVVYDSGSGLSIYGIQLAKMGIKVIAVSAHNLYDEFLFLLKEITANELELVRTSEDGATVIGRARGMRVDVLGTLANAIEVSIPPQFRVISLVGPPYGAWELQEGVTLEGAARAIAGLVTEMETRLASPVYKQNLQRVTNSVQEHLLEVPDNSLDGVVDAYGAYFYSEGKVDLIKSFYKKLKPGGKAFIAVAYEPTFSGYETDPLYAHLSRVDPTRFELHQRPSPHIVVKKPKRGGKLRDKVFEFERPQRPRVDLSY
ncbi:MAG: hypothetical protein AB1540_08960 [Bdellovibrionota bacterium]